MTAVKVLYHPLILCAAARILICVKHAGPAKLKRPRKVKRRSVPLSALTMPISDQKLVPSNRVKTKILPPRSFSSYLAVPTGNGVSPCKTSAFTTAPRKRYGLKMNALRIRAVKPPHSQGTRQTQNLDRGSLDRAAP